MNTIGSIHMKKLMLASTAAAALAGAAFADGHAEEVKIGAVSYTHLTLPTIA